MKKLILFLLLISASAFSFADTVIGSDNCTRSDGAIGANWTIVQGTWVVGSNRCYASTVPGNANPVRRTAEVYGADQYSQVTYAAFNATNRFGPAVRIPAATKSGYTAYCSAISGSNCTSVILAKVAADVYTTLQTTPANLSPGTRVSLRVIGSKLTIYANDVLVNAEYTDTTFSAAGAPGMFQYGGSAGGATAWEGGTPGVFAMGAPTISPPSSSYMFGFPVTITQPVSGATCYYTTNGTTPTTGSIVYSAPFSSATSGSQTIKTFCTKAGYSDSAVVSTTYTISNPGDSTTIVSDNFSSYYDANLDPSLTQQMPLDKGPTLGRWMTTSGGGTSSGYGNLIGIETVPLSTCTPVVSGKCVMVAKGDQFATYIGRTGFASDQWAQTRVTKSSTASNSTAAGPCVRCSTVRGTTSGYAATAGTGDTVVNLVKLGYGPIATGTATTSLGSTIRIRVSGTSLEVLIDGVSVIQYVDSSSPVTTGNPGIYLTGVFTGLGAALSDFTAGNVGAADGTAIVSYSPNIVYTDTAMNTSSWVAGGWPWFYSGINNGDYFTAPIGPLQISGSLYGPGNTTYGGIAGYPTAHIARGGIMTLRGGEFGPTGQWQRFKVGLDPLDDRMNNWFATLGDEVWAPNNGFDQIALYNGVQTFAQMSSVKGLLATCGRGQGTGEYTCSPFWHTTMVSPTRSPLDQVLTVAASFFTPRIGDEIFEQLIGSSLSAACKGAAPDTVMQRSTTYAQGWYVNSAGDLYHGGGTTGATEPVWFDIFGAWGVPTLAYTGTPDATTYTYSLQMTSSSGLPVTTSGPAKVTNGPSTLSGTNYITITIPQYPNVASCEVYRVEPFSQQGLIGTTSCGGGITTLVDNGLTADGSVPPSNFGAPAATRDGTATWFYYGKPCPTSDKFSWIPNYAPGHIDVPEFANRTNGRPGIWVQGLAPVLYDWSAGTATSTSACSLDANLCSSTVQPAVWMTW